MQLLLSKPDLLLLDEPTNHLDAETVSWLERTLREYEGCVIVVTHDRYFLDNVTRWILELESGKGIPWEANYSDWLRQKAEKMRQKEKAASKRQRALNEELAWIQMSQKARHAKGKARLNRYEEMLVTGAEDSRKRTDIVLPQGPRLGDVVIRAEGVGKGYGERLLYGDLTFDLPRSGIVGIIGPNGAGKTTLFRMITGEEQPNSGTLTVGDTVKLAYVDQSRDDLEDGASVWENLSLIHI